MNFFEAQDEARRASRRLVLAYIVATLLIVASVAVVSDQSVQSGELLVAIAQ